MKLYHGSRRKLDKLEPQQASAAEGLHVPEGELLFAIYLTPSYEYAVAMGARTKGVTHINDDHTIEFKNPEFYNPEDPIYVYEVDSEKIPNENMQESDEGMQIAVVDIPEIIPDAIQELKAGDVEKYYEIREFNEEVDSEKGSEGSAGEFGKSSRR